MDESRKKTIEQTVENYHAQLKIVGNTNMTLYDYLNKIWIRDEELQYAYKYNAKRKTK